MGVVSAVEARSRSLVAGEKCRGGGVSRESSLTGVLRWMEQAVYQTEVVEKAASRCFQADARQNEFSVSGSLQVIWPRSVMAACR